MWPVCSGDCPNGHRTCPEDPACQAWRPLVPIPHTASVEKENQIRADPAQRQPTPHPKSSASQVQGWNADLGLAALRPDALFALQRNAGNQAVCQLFAQRLFIGGGPDGLQKI